MRWFGGMGAWSMFLKCPFGRNKKWNGLTRASEKLTPKPQKPRKKNHKTFVLLNSKNLPKTSKPPKKKPLKTSITYQYQKPLPTKKKLQKKTAQAFSPPPPLSASRGFRCHGPFPVGLRGQGLGRRLAQSRRRGRRCGARLGSAGGVWGRRYG